MSPDRWARTILDSLKEIGVQITEVRQRKHLVYHCAFNSFNFTWTVSKTPGDFRADNIALKYLRRELRRCGIEEPPRFNVRGEPKPTLSVEAWDALRDWEKYVASAA